MTHSHSFLSSDNHFFFLNDSSVVVRTIAVLALIVVSRIQTLPFARFLRLSYYKLRLLRDRNSSGDRVDVLKMATQVATLSEVLFADITLVWSLHGVLPEVVSQVAALAEDGLTPLILAPEIQFGTLCVPVVDLDCLVPLLRDPLELLGERSFAGNNSSRTLASGSPVLIFP